MADIAAPTGTVTFLFTDVEGSSRLWDEQRTAMSAALERHDAILRGTIASFGGYVFATGGDGFAAAFGRADAALRAAADGQRLLTGEAWPVGARVRVRMGLHTGEAQERDGNYFGPAVNRAARVMDAGHGGQILLSATTAGLVSDGSLETQVVGELALKGLTRPETVSQLVGEGLEADFPALRARAVRLGNLPTVRDAIIGRSIAIAEIGALCQEHRLVTLTGVGGVGKTRLALAVAESIADRFDDGVWFVELAEVLDEAGVVPSIASTLGVQLQGGRSLSESLVDALEQQRVMLVFDNCEHLIGETSNVIDQILGRAENVVVLATSREGLALQGERLAAVAPLSTGDGVGSPAVDLFVERATAAGWTQPDDLRPVVELCDRLDGVPLALELAAARARSISVTEMMERLEDRFRLLKGSRRSVDRHHTLRATVAWSYDLLELDEQRLFNRLSVFAGGFDLDAAEAVCADDELDKYDIADLMGALVDKSMVSRSAELFSLLETLRQFGAEQLVGTDDPDRIRNAHLVYYGDFAERARHGLMGSEEALWWHRLKNQWSDVRAAFRWAHDANDTPAAMGIAVQLGSVGLWRSRYEPYSWAYEAIEMPGAMDLPEYAHCLGRIAMAHVALGDLDQADEWARQAHAAGSDSSFDLDQFGANAAATVLLWQGRGSEAAEVWDRMANRSAAHGPRSQQALHIATQAVCAVSLAEFGDAIRLAQEAQNIADGVGNSCARSWSRWAQGYALAESDPLAAIPLLEEALDIAEPAGLSWVIVNCRRVLAHAYTVLDDPRRGLRFAIESVRVARREGGWAFVWTNLLYSAIALDQLGESVIAAKLLGAVSVSPVAGIETIQRRMTEVQQRLETTLPVEEVASLLDHGRNLSVHHAAELVETTAAAHLR